MAERTNRITRFTNKEESSESRKLVPLAGGRFVCLGLFWGFFVCFFFYTVWWKACIQFQFLYHQKSTGKDRKDGRQLQNDPGSHRDSPEKFSPYSLLKQRLRAWFNHSVEAGTFLRRQDASFSQQKQAKSQWLQVKNIQNKTRVSNHQFT